MRTSSTILIAVPALLLCAGAAPVPTQLQPRSIALVADPSNIHVEHAWARASIGAMPTSAIYFSLTDTGQPDRLVGCSTPVATSAQLHETIHDNGVMKMRPVPGLPLTPGQPVTLSPGGYHVMLMGLKAPLKQGETFPLTLTFEHAPPVTVTIAVEGIAGQ